MSEINCTFEVPRSGTRIPLVCREARAEWPADLVKLTAQASAPGLDMQIPSLQTDDGSLASRFGGDKMPEINTEGRIKLDPWAASSLLQKSIRRGEVGLAQYAAACLHRQRGNAIWRRLMAIAIEDIGIADLDLVWEVVQLATDRALRSSLSANEGFLAEMCARLARAPKDRSVDYLYCAATRLETALQDRQQFDASSIEDREAIVADQFQPLTRRAVAALSLCSREIADGEIMDVAAVRQLIISLSTRFPRSLTDLLLTLAAKQSHPYSLMLLLLWSRLYATGGPSGIADDDLPEPAFVGIVPLYTYDKHTAVGKRAITELARQNANVRGVLANWVPETHWVPVTLMAAFYVDAMPLANRLEWSASSLLETVGTTADMTFAGCRFEGIRPVLETVRDELPTINELRRANLLAKAGPSRPRF